MSINLNPYKPLVRHWMQTKYFFPTCFILLEGIYCNVWSWGLKWWPINVGSSYITHNKQSIIYSYSMVMFNLTLLITSTLSSLFCFPGVFAACHDFVNPDKHHETCLKDFCIDSESVVDSFATYATRCRNAGGSAVEWRDEIAGAGEYTCRVCRDGFQWGFLLQVFTSIQNWLIYYVIVNKGFTGWSIGVVKSKLIWV